MKEKERQANAILQSLMLPRMNILQCQKLAEDLGYDKALFTLNGPTGSLECQWIDACMGLFRIGKDKGFVTVGQFQFIPDLYCSNLRLPESEQPASVPNVPEVPLHK